MLFLELVQVALGNRDRLSHDPSENEWKELFSMSLAQTVAGVTFLALEKLSHIGQKPPQSILFEWLALFEQTRARNGVLNKRCAEITQMLANAGFQSCILKGQGNALMYPEPNARTAGDIDVWIDAGKQEIVDYVTGLYPKAAIQNQHIEFPVFEDVDVEAHFKPAASVSIRYDRTFKAFFEKDKYEQFQHRVSLPDEAGEICVPTLDFNVIFQMSHMMKHFFSEGLGMRHVMDYYFLLQKWNKENGKGENNNTAEIRKTLRSLGMRKFAGGIMWVLHEALGMKEDWMVCEPNERRGKIILKEMMIGGNFGHGDSRFSKKLMRKSATLSIITRNAKLAWLFPEEAIAAPISNVVRGIGGRRTCAGKALKKKRAEP